MAKVELEEVELVRGVALEQVQEQIRHQVFGFVE